MTQASPPPAADPPGASGTTYVMGHSRAVTAAHALRTVHNCASFLIPHLRPDMRILDLGCGPGSITCGFSAFVPQGSVVGVDTSPEVVAEARELLLKRQSESADSKPGEGAAAAASLTNVSFQVADVLSAAGLPFPDASFDVVYTHMVLVHIPDPVKALREMRRVLKSPGGMVACREGDTFSWHPESDGLVLWSQGLNKLLEKAGGDMRAGRHLKEWCRKAGFAMGEEGFGSGNVMFQAGAISHTTREDRAWMAQVQMARLDKDKGAGVREKFVKAGFSEDEVDKMVQGLKDWAEREDGWYACLCGEIICWT